ncbi:MAG: hypothetical protein DRN04_14615 [Thermoprotei archaeon]|nr:MAG: hypothetical protein DRN04_14615 [Thermoprotei archaeon]
MEEKINKWKFLLEEYKTLREEILSRIRLRYYYEYIMLIFSYSIISLSLILYPENILSSLLISISLQAVITILYMIITRLIREIVKIGSYISARLEHEKMLHALPWEYIIYIQAVERKFSYGKPINVSPHNILAFALYLISFIQTLLYILEDYNLTYTEYLFLAISLSLLVINIGLFQKYHDSAKFRKYCYNNFSEQLQQIRKQTLLSHTKEL